MRKFQKIKKESSQNNININNEFLSLVLPENTLKYFDIIWIEKIWEWENKTLKIILEEKNNPPLEELGYSNSNLNNHKIKIISKWFKNIRIDDFPIRSYKVELIFRRRIWQIELENWENNWWNNLGINIERKLIKRNIEIAHKWTQLEKEFALFLKEGDWH